MLSTEQAGFRLARARFMPANMTIDMTMPARCPTRSIAGIAAWAALCAVMLSGCASNGEWPSLARRAAEKNGGRQSGTAAPVLPGPGATVSQQAVPGDLAARLARLEQAARESHGEFGRKQSRAAALAGAARGAATGTEQWAVATVALAELESARSDVMVSLGELDRLYAAERIDGGDGEAIAAVRDQVTAWVADEDAVLADLGNRLKS